MERNECEKKHCNKEKNVETHDLINVKQQFFLMCNDYFI